MKKLWLILLLTLTLALVLCAGVASADRNVSTTVGDYTVEVANISCLTAGHWEITPTLTAVSVTDGDSLNVKNISFTVAVYCEKCDATETYASSLRLASEDNCDAGYRVTGMVKPANTTTWYVNVSGPAFEHVWTGWYKADEENCYRYCRSSGCKAKETLPHELSDSQAYACTELQTCSRCGGEVALGHDYDFDIRIFPSTPDEPVTVYGKCQRSGCWGDGNYISFTADKYEELELIYMPCVTGYGYGKLTYRVTFTYNGVQQYIEKAVQTADRAPGEHGMQSNGDGTHSCTNALCPAKDIKLDCTPGAEATCANAQTCTVCGGELKPALPHQYEYELTSLPSAQWPNGQAFYNCRNVNNCGVYGYVSCDTYTVDSETPPTCYQYGKLSYTATFTLDGQQYTISATYDSGSPTGQHSYGYNGDGTHSCQTPGCLEQNIACIPVVDLAVAPTCTSTGLTEGSHCDACGAILTARQTIAKRYHELGDWTPNNKGSHNANCRNCTYRTVRRCTTVAIPVGENKVSVCLVCGQFGDIILPIAYAQDYVWDEDVKPTEAPLLVRAQVEPFEGAIALITVAWESGGSVLDPLGDVGVRIDLPKLGDFRVILPDGTEVPFTYENDQLHLKTDKATAFILVAP